VRLSFAQIDAFTHEPFTGNPAAVMPLHGWLDDAVLQAIAAENNLSETAFLVPIAASDDEGGDAPDFELRWFTPSAEVVLCGHATLASGHFVLSADPQRDRVRFRTRHSGVLEVARSEGGYRMALPAWHAEPRPLPDLVAALGLDGNPATFWHANRYGMVVVETAEQVRALDPDFRAMAQAGDVLTIVTAPGTGDSAGTDIVSRAFAPGAGVDEDPVTGSAHSVLVPYWANRLGRHHFTAYQASRRGGYLDCRADGDRVILGGQCVTVIEGSFLL
jgi:PhzF family phenazine biosynthesis protein